MNRVAVDVAEFLDSLSLAPDVEIVITRFPERNSLDGAESMRGVLLQHLECGREFGALGFADQKMDVFGHDYVSRDVEVIPSARAFENFEEGVAGFGSAEEWVAMLTAEGDEVETVSFLEMLQTPGHGLRVDVGEVSRCDLREKTY